MRRVRTYAGATVALAGLLLALSGSAGAGDHDDDRDDDRHEDRHGDRHGDKDRDRDEAFNRIATFPVHLNTGAAESAAEIVTSSEDGKTLIYTDSLTGKIGFVDIHNPASPQADGTMDMGGEPTSVAVAGKYALVAVDTSADFVDVSGKLVVVDIGKRQVAATIDLDGQPDCVAVSPDGKYAAVVIENERDEDLGDGRPPQAPGGFLVVVRLKSKPSSWTTEEVSLSGIADKFPDDPEPEFVDINEDNLAVVSLQENNHFVLVDLEDAEVVGDFPAGSVDLEDIDTVEDDRITLDGSLSDVLREPDAVQWIGDDAVLSANEGDLDGGSRGFTVFKKNGTVLFDSASDYEHLAVRHGHYPESRSENKGSEPEGAEVAQYDRDRFAFVGSERGNFVAVYDMSDKRDPEFLQLLPCTNGPEGLHAIPCRDLFVVASEEDLPGEGIRSTIAIYKLESGDPDYPQILSCNDGDGLPIPWGALSGLAADRSDKDILYAITDSYYSGRPRILKIDVDREPARIVDEIVLTESGVVVTNYDLEGIVQRADGSFWVVSEGVANNSLKNLLVRVDADGAVQEEVELPAAVQSLQTSNGFEGVAVVEDNGTEIVYVAIQREWSGDPSGKIRIGEYRPSTGAWRFFYYPKATPPAGATVGLSEIVALDKETFALIERDNQRGPNATVKWITEISIAGVTPVAQGGTFPTLTKALVRDLLPDLNETKGWTQDKVEGLAISIKGKTYVVTDNDGVDDSTGETQFFRLGRYDDLGND